MTTTTGGRHRTNHFGFYRQLKDRCNRLSLFISSKSYQSTGEITMIFLKLVVVICALIVVTYAACPITERPVEVIECLRHITIGLVGAATNDLKRVCKMATDIALCVQSELRECIAAEIGKGVLNEILILTTRCCPQRNQTDCPIRDQALQEQRCFAADSLVTLDNGDRKTMADLRSGDAILAYDDTTKKVVSTQVITLLDNEPTKFALFKQLTTATGRQLSLTSSHLLPTVSHGYLMAKKIQVGMDVYIMNDKGLLTVETISDVSDVVKQGYVAPLTQEGTLIVDGFAASCYATINSHQIAHTVLAPMRWWYSMFGSSQQASVGVHWFPQMVYDLTAFLVPSIIHH